MLVGDRSLGFGAAGRVPFTAIESYARLIGITHPDEVRRFVALIQRMDGAYLAHLAARRPADGK